MPPHPSQQQTPYGTAYSQAPQGAPAPTNNPYGSYQYSTPNYGQQPTAPYPPSTFTAQQVPQQQQQQQQPIQSQQPTDRTTCFDTQHTDVIHDAQLDYYGRRLATASSDRSVRVFSVEPGQEPILQGTLTGHNGPVWQVSWAHPQFGSILASCSFDGTVLIWKENSGAQSTSSPYGKPASSAWQKIKEHKVHEGSSVNAIAWAPFESGLKLACASSDGRVSVLSCNVDSDQQWESVEFHAHAVGCNAVSWAPVTSTNILQNSASKQQQPNRPLLATGGCDNLIRLWTWNESEHNYTQQGAALEGHSDWIRDVAFNPADRHLLASCSQDKTVRIWKCAESGNTWTSQLLSKEPFADSLWRLSWSVAGALLAVAGGDNKITLWREDGAGTWELTGSVDN